MISSITILSRTSSAESGTGLVVDMEDDAVDQQIILVQNQAPAQQNILHIGLVRTVFGPVVPPSMQWKAVLDVVIPELLLSAPSRSVFTMPILPFMFSKTNCLLPLLSILPAMDKALPIEFSIISEQRSVARSIYFDEVDAVPTQREPTLFSASPIQLAGKKRKCHAKKVVVEAPVIDNVYRHSTRSSVKRDGYRPLSMSDTVSRPRKRTKKVKVIPMAQTEDGPAAVDNIPETPIQVIQNVGTGLGIDPELLTVEKLKAAPKITKKKSVPHDE
jgi:hypothetical protein